MGRKTTREIWSQQTIGGIMEAVHEAAALIEERLESIEVTLSRTNKILEQIALVMINRYRHERYGLEEIRSLDELE